MQIISENFALDGKEFACNAEDLNSNSGLGRSPGEGNGYPHQYSCLENPMDRGAWRATVLGVTESAMTERLTLSPQLTPEILKFMSGRQNYKQEEQRCGIHQT